MHYVVKLKDGTYQGMRNDKVSFNATRTPKQGVPLDRARIFNSKSAGVRSMAYVGLKGEIVPVTIKEN